MFSQECLGKSDFAYIQKNSTIESKKHLKKLFSYSVVNEFENVPPACSEEIIEELFDLRDFGFDGTCYRNYDEENQFVVYQIKNCDPIYIYKCEQFCFNWILNDCENTLKGAKEINNGDYNSISYSVSGTTLEFRTYFGSFEGQFVLFYNKKQVQEKINEQTRKQAEIERKQQEENARLQLIQAKVDSLVTIANDMIRLGKFLDAKSHLMEANILLPSEIIRSKIINCEELYCLTFVKEGDRLLNDKLFKEAISQYEKSRECISDQTLINDKIKLVQNQIMNDSVSQLIQVAENEFENKQYVKSRELFSNIIKLDRKNIQANQRVNDIDMLLKFLAERKVKTYDYSLLDGLNYSTNKKAFEKNLIEFLKPIDKGQLTIGFDFHFDTLGINRSNFFLEGDTRKKYQPSFDVLTKKFVLIPPLKNEYFVNAQKIDNYNIEWNSDNAKYKYNSNTVKLKSGFNTNTEEISSFISTKSTYGTYYLEYKWVAINQDTFKTIKVTGYKAKAGPLNVIYSMILPGVGTKRVTYGEKGTGRMISFLVSGAIAYGAKMYSDQQYSLYLNTQGNPSLDYYNRANRANHVFITSLGIAGTFYIYDFFHVLGKGFKNMKNNKIVNAQIPKFKPIMMEEIALPK